ncbi:MAG: EAL domain-containing protein [Actinobacteria bacterium]|nr:EAL domain-containing protein [Actinomycetota bacterium]
MHAVRTLRDRSRRSVSVLVAVMVVCGMVTVLGTQYLVESFRDSALNVDHEATVSEDIKSEIVAHATLAGGPTDAVSDQQRMMLEAAIRIDFGEAIDGQDVPAARTLLEQSLREWETLVRDLRRLGDADVVGRGRAVSQRVPTVLALIDRSGAAVRGQVRADVADAERVERTALTVIVVLELLAIWLVVRLAQSTSSRLIRPLGALRDSANRLAAGDLDHRVDVDRSDEIGELATSFNAMADAIASSQRELAREASTDGLSGLANRSAFSARLDAVLAQPDRRAGAQAVLFVDLDDFKEVNDRHGHEAGDVLLREVASRLERVMRPGDLVARLGGDEFALLLDDLLDPAVAAAIGERIVDSLYEPIEIGDDSVHIGASVGVVVRGADSTASQLMRQADIAMYAAKSKGKNRVEVFDAGLDEATMTRLLLRADVRLAVERHELTLEFQPIIELHTGTVVGLEAVPRWVHPTKGVLPTATFVALAEETGAIVGLGAWVLETAARHVAAWRRRYGSPDLWVSVDVAQRQIEAADFADVVTAIVAGTDLPTANVVLEVAESVLTHSSAARDAMLARLRDIGVRIALDDFGTGYSSVGYLRQLPLDMIKIDRSFTADARSGSDGDELLGAIVTLTRQLGLDVVPEGIDDIDQLERLRGMGCRLGQGEVLCPPLTTSGIETLLAHEPANQGQTGWQTGLPAPTSGPLALPS